MLRSVVVAVAVSALTLGLAAAKPTPTPVEKPPPLLKKPVLDPAWSKQLTAHPAKVTVPDIKQQIEPPPNFAALKRMTLDAKAIVLQTAPEQVAGPLRFSAQRPYLDTLNYLELESGNGKVSLRTAQNYAFFSGPDAVLADIFVRPEAHLVFQAEPGRRYMLECAVDVSGTQPGTISATARGLTYSVSSADRATLLFRLDPVAISQSVLVEIGGDRPWYLDGCELSWTGA